MSRRSIVLCSCLLLTASAGVAQVDEDKKLEPYLTKEGKLKAPLEVIEEWKHTQTIQTVNPPGNQTRRWFTFAGTTWRIEPDGRWTVRNIFRDGFTGSGHQPNDLQLRRLYLSGVTWRPAAEGQGTLSKDQLRALARVLADNELLKLQGGGLDARVNHHFFTLRFGPHEVAMTVGVDQKPAKIPSAQPGRAEAGRVQAIAEAVKSAIDRSRGQAK